MGLLGDSFDDPRSAAIMALAGGMVQGNFGGGLLGASQAYAQTKAGLLDAQMKQMQMENYKSEMEARKLATIKDQRQQALMESFFPGMTGQPGAQPSQPSISPGAYSPPAGGGVGPVLPMPTQSAPAGGNDILALSKQLGIPVQAIQADMVFNGGKKISEMISARAMPKWENVNGNLVNTNEPGFTGGLQPFMKVSNNGQSSMGIPDPTAPGGIRIVTPQGAVENYSAFKSADASIAAQNDLVQVYNPITKQMDFKPRSAVLAAQTQPPSVAPTVAPNLRTAPPRPNALTQPGDADKAQIYATEIAKEQDKLRNPGQYMTPQMLQQDPDMSKFRASTQANIDGLQREARSAGVPATPAGGSSGVAAGAPIRTAGQEALDREFAKDYAAFSAAGGYSDVLKQLNQLKVATNALTPGSGITGSVVGFIPDSIRASTNPQAVNIKELVQESVQRNLRPVLGAQFTENEGTRLINRAYNPLLPPEENKRRVDRLITQIGQAAAQKADAAQYFEQNGTLAGWQGKLPSFSDFNPEGRDSGGKVTNAPAGPASGGWKYIGPVK